MVFTHLPTVFTPGFYGFYSFYKFPSDPHVCRRQTPDVNCCSALGKDIAAAQFPCNRDRNAARSFRIISTQSTPCQLPINFMNKLKVRVLPVPFNYPESMKQCLETKRVCRNSPHYFVHLSSRVIWACGGCRDIGN